MVEIHGSLYESRCFRCDREPFPDDTAYEGPDLPACERCRERGESGLIRPNVVWFGELLNPAHLDRIDRFMQSAATGRLVFLAAGTSGAVYPAAGLVLSARSAGAETWLVNAEPADNTSAFHHFVQGPSGEVLPRLLGGVK
jgi:NAD-dependent deacetylase